MESIKKVQLNTLKKWMEDQPHLPNISDEQLALFLHSCYFNIEEAQTAIDNYFTFKTQNKDFFNYPPNREELAVTLDTVYIGILPQKTPDNHMVLLFRIMDPRPESYCCLLQCNQYLMSILLFLHQNGPADGIVVICDGMHYSWGHLWRSSLGIIRKMIYLVQETLPVRVKGIHVVNLTPMVGKLAAICKPFMKKELYELLQFHTNFETLHNFVPRECLPKEYDGYHPSYLDLQEEHKRNLLEHRAFFDWHSTQLVDESKRAKKNGYFGGVWSKLRY